MWCRVFDLGVVRNINKHKVVWKSHANRMGVSVNDRGNHCAVWEAPTRCVVVQAPLDDSAAGVAADCVDYCVARCGGVEVGW